MRNSITKRLADVERRLALVEHTHSEFANKYDPEVLVRLATNLVSARLCVSVEAINGRSRVESIAVARFLAVYLVRRYSTLSLSQIGALFGRDHGSILNAIRRVSSIAETDPYRGKQIAGIEREFAFLSSLSPRDAIAA